MELILQNNTGAGEKKGKIEFCECLHLWQRKVGKHLKMQMK